MPFILLINKLDLINEWEVKDPDLAALSEKGWQVVATSAKTGVGVNETFQALGQRTLEG